MSEKNNTAAQETMQLPLLCVRNNVLFPGVTLNFEIDQPHANETIREAMTGGISVIVAAEKPSGNPAGDWVESLMHTAESNRTPQPYDVGVRGLIRQVIHIDKNRAKVLVEGIERVHIEETETGSRGMICRYSPFPLEKEKKKDEYRIVAGMALIRRCISDLIGDSEEIRESAFSMLKTDDPEVFFRTLIYHSPMPVEQKQEILEQASRADQFELLYNDLEEQKQILQAENELREKTKDIMDEENRQYYLRETMRQIAQELGEETDPIREHEELTEKIQALEMQEKDKQKLLKDAKRLSGLPTSAQEGYVLRTYLDTVLDLPWNQESGAKIQIKRAASVLDKDHYGLEKVKREILEALAVRSVNEGTYGQILCLVGPPGVGKTSVGKSIARALGRAYERVSLGGVRDESDIRGHRKTYIGAMPGRIAEALIRAKARDAVILLDEVDKMGTDYRGDPAAALLEVLDSEQNKAFRDHYIEVAFDLSHVLFIATANDASTIPAPLLDRMDVIHLGSYTREEKYHIAREHLVKKQLKKHGLKGTACRFTDEILYELIDLYTQEAGVRQLERLIAKLCRRACLEIVEGNCKRVVFTKEMLREYLGTPKFKPDLMVQTDRVGMVNGLAWTAVGGTLMPLEVITFPGQGKIELTGSLGDVMKESANIAVSYTRSAAEQYAIEQDFYQKKDMHIHAPEGAIPKDGPSAGVTMTTAIISALTGRPVRHDVAMTGEITLHGDVLPIGGLREKTMAAYRSGIKTVIIPADNVPDLDDIDPTVRSAIEFVPAKTLRTVLDTALLPLS